MTERKQIDIGEEDDDQNGEGPAAEAVVDPDEFYAKSAFRIVYQTNNFFLPQVRDLIEKRGVLNIRPKYQRRLRWTNRQKSRLIESLLLNIPVPPIFLYETQAAQYEVMDGQQRLNTVNEFITGQFPLSGLEVLQPLNGLGYAKLPPRVRRGLDRASLSAIVLLLESDSASVEGRLSITEIRRFIFDRLNTGGTRLNKQEIRNAIYPGYFNAVIHKIARFDKFTTVFDIPAYTQPETDLDSDTDEYYEHPQRQKNKLYAAMGDCQLILRYFALKEPENIRGSMASMLDRAMKLRVKISKEEALRLRDNYQDRFGFLFDLFDGRPFELPADERGNIRVSAALYDASMVAIDQLWGRREEIKDRKEEIKKKVAIAVAEGSSSKILTGQANTAQAVRDRIEILKLALTP